MNRVKFQKEEFQSQMPGRGAVLAGAGLGMMSTTGNNVYCPLDNDSFFCQLSRFTSVLSMIIYILVVFALIVYIMYVIYSSISGSKKTFF